MRRSIDLGASPSLSFDAGVDPGHAWHLVVFVNNDKVLDRLIEAAKATDENTSAPHWEPVHLDLANYAGKSVVVRLYDFILVPNLQAGNSYWRHIEVQ